MAGSAMGHWRTSYWPKCRTCLGTILVISSIGPLSVVHSELILQETLHPRLISEDNAYKKDPTEPSLLPNDSRASRTPRSFPPSSSVRSSSTALSIANLSSASLRNMADYDKDLSAKEHTTPHHGSGSDYVDEEVGVVHKSAALNRDLKSRHMQMIAIGGAIGAGLFVSSGSALHSGGPASLVICYTIIGIMLLFTCQALAEMAVLFPVNGAFYTYVVRFIDPSWGFAMGWDYAISWLTILPFELVAASITISFWRDDLNMGIWVTVFLVVLASIQVFGVRGYGEVEFVLSMIKICACVGFIILGIIINCGGVGNQGYLGAKYWHDPGAFRNGFNGFCSVFVTAAFAFGGTELVGLAAAESANPRKAIPRATKQVFWRIFFFYVVNLFILGLIIRSDDERLLGSSGANTKASPFVLAIQDAGIKVLPSIFNAVITLSVISVANSCTFGSTRTMQAMAERGMGPKILAYVDGSGRPIWCIVVQILFGFLAFIGEAAEQSTVFTWLLSISGLSYFFVWGTICATHIRFRKAWKAHGYTLDQIPYKPTLGVVGSWIGLILCGLCLIATFYSSLYPSPDATPNAQVFFENYLAAPIVIGLYLFWKVYSRDWRLLVPIAEMDLKSGVVMADPSEYEEPKGNWVMRIVHGLF